MERLARVFPDWVVAPCRRRSLITEFSLSTLHFLLHHFGYLFEVFTILLLGSRPKIVALWLSDTSVVSFLVVWDWRQSPVGDAILTALILSVIVLGWALCFGKGPP